jgi:hypothetical protein
MRESASGKKSGQIYLYASRLANVHPFTADFIAASLMLGCHRNDDFRWLLREKSSQALSLHDGA